VIHLVPRSDLDVNNLEIVALVWDEQEIAILDVSQRKLWLTDTDQTLNATFFESLDCEGRAVVGLASRVIMEDTLFHFLDHPESPADELEMQICKIAIIDYLRRISN